MTLLQLTTPNAEVIQTVSELDRFVKIFCDASDNRAGWAPRADELLGMFAPEAIVVSHRSGRALVERPEGYVIPRIALLTDGHLLEFHEWELEAQTEIAGPLASRRSRYAQEGVRDGYPYKGHGVRWFQFANLGSLGWRIVSLSWLDD